jgi:hypothetical protein
MSATRYAMMMRRAAVTKSKKIAPPSFSQTGLSSRNDGLRWMQ